jgi:putative ABC transport system permease protein
MPRLRLLARVKALVTNRRLDDEFTAELQSHIDLLADEHVARGVDPAEARRLAAVRVGNITSLRMQHRDMRGFPLVEDFWQDLRFAARLIVKERWFSAAAIVAIALGIGANTLGFTIINAAFLRGFPFEEADRLRAVSWRPNSGIRTSSSPLDLADWRSQTQSFTGIAAYQFGAINISDDHAPPEQTQGAWVTANHFDVLRQRPVLGRTFVAGDEQRGATPVVIIGYEIWNHRFGLDPQVVGRILRVNGEPRTIIGVMPERMKFPDNAGSELWLPFVPTDAQLVRDRRMLGVFGRLAPGVSATAATAEMDAIAQRIKAADPEHTRNLAGAQLETFVDRFLGGAARPMLITVMGAVIFVLLIACANVANLLLSRAMYRTREVAVRRTLGATRGRVVRQLLIESIALSSLGGVLGLGLAWYGVRAFDVAIQASGAPFWLSFTMDYRVLLYVAAICITTGVLFGLAPALQTSNANQADTLKEGARGSVGTRRANRFGNGLVVGELALTVVLLCGAGLMLRSFVALYTIDPGFAVDGLMRTRMQLPPAKYPTPESRRQFHEQLLPRLSAIPGVQAATIATSVPPLDQEEWRFEVDGRTYTGDEWPWAGTLSIAPSYFDVLGVAITRGRALVATDGAPGAENIVINAAMASRIFPGEDPIGRRIKFVPRSANTALPEDAAFAQPWRTIVGVTAPFLQGSSDDAFRSPVVYVPLQQSAPRTASVMVRSNLPPGEVMTAIRAAVQSLDADQPVFNIQSIAAVMQEERLIYRIFATLFGVLATIGLALSAVGIYGVMAYAVTQRTQEIGVRMAIGARRWDVTWLFLRRGLIQVALGLAIGLPAALGLASVAQFQLVEIEPSDPVTMIGITAAVIVVALTACVVPARRAARVDPAIALRSE